MPPSFAPPSPARRAVGRAWLLAAVAIGLAGCARGPGLVPIAERVTIDRSVIEYPAGFELVPFARNLTAPTAMAFDTTGGPNGGTLLVADDGAGPGASPTVVAFRADGTTVDVFPKRSGRIRLTPGGFQFYGPVGGLAVREGEIFVSHRDRRGDGVITAVTYDGRRRTVVGGLPARGDGAVTDLAFSPTDGRLYFGLGTATNSGVVGLDNWANGWVRKRRGFADRPLGKMQFLGARFDTPNPEGGLFGGDDRVVTSAFNPFARSDQRVPAAIDGKPTGAIYSVDPAGGDLRVEAHGLRNPRGLVFNAFGNLFATNDGMELRGTRPVKDDPDALLRVPLGGPTWYGWPDYSADLRPIGEEGFQPPVGMARRTGYGEIFALTDLPASGLYPPDRATLLRAVFPALSGAAGADFPPPTEPFADYRESMLVALAGDRAPFATGGLPLVRPVGRKVVAVDLSTREPSDFISNTTGLPGSQSRQPLALERPIAVRSGPDGAVYVLDFGRASYPDGRPRPAKRTGRVYRLAPVESPTTRPADAGATEPVGPSPDPVPDLPATP